MFAEINAQVFETSSKTGENISEYQKVINLGIYSYFFNVLYL